MLHQHWSITANAKLKPDAVVVFGKVHKTIWGLPLTAQRKTILPANATEDQCIAAGLRLIEQIKP